MGLPLVLLKRRRSGGSLAFSPVSLFAGADTGWVYDLSDMSTLFQDAAGTTHVTAVGQPVGLELDKSEGTPTARRNLLTRTEEFDNAAWTKANATVTANTAVAPDGTTTADKLTPDGASTFHNVSSSLTNTAVTHILSVYAKADGYSWLRLNFSGSSGDCFFDLQNGVVGTAGSTATITDMGNGWYRCAMSSAASVNATIAINVASADGVTSFAGNGTSGILIWGAQLELGSTATDYQKITSGLNGEWTPGNHRAQGTALNRPTYARHPLGGIRNLLTQTGFDGAVSGTPGTAPTDWPFFSSGGTQTVDPAGGSLGGASVQIEVTANRHYYQRSLPLPDNTTQTFSVAGTCVVGEQLLQLVTVTGTTTGITTVYKVNGVTQASSSTLPVGEFVLQLVITTTTGHTNNNIRLGIGASNTATGNITFRDPQLELGSTATAYQRVGSTIDVTEAGVEDLYYLSYDGINDSLATASFAWGTDKATVVAGVRKLSDAASGMLVERSVLAPSNNGAFNLQASAAPPNQYRFYSGGSERGLAIADVSSGFAAPITNVMTAIGDIPGDTATLRLDGSQVAQSTVNQGTGDYLAYQTFFGARAGTSNFFNGREYSNVGINRLLTTDELAALESWTAGKNGVTL